MGESRSEWVTQLPAPTLAPFVERYVGYRLAGFPAGIHRGLPSRHLTFIVSIGQRINVVAQSDQAQAPSRYRSVIAGLAASPALIAHDGDQEGVAVELTPLGSRALFGMPARVLWNTSLELVDLEAAAGEELWERLQLVQPWEGRFAVCDDVLCRLVRDDPVEPALGRCWQLLTASVGTVPVAELARRIGWTRQHFARRFADEFGLPPKLAARIVRFDRARRMLQATPAYVSIAQVAATCGFYDQAHLTRDFAEFAGVPPGRLLVDDLPSVQDSTDSDPQS